MSTSLQGIHSTMYSLEKPHQEAGPCPINKPHLKAHALSHYTDEMAAGVGQDKNSQLLKDHFRYRHKLTFYTFNKSLPLPPQVDVLHVRQLNWGYASEVDYRNGGRVRGDRREKPMRLRLQEGHGRFISSPASPHATSHAASWIE
ncbi:hypothetical protein GGR53DRAFT_462882 [Hypoxylon sp. FL1150]|nr:hypothetical protein GGR53DRAFT_462882 [Hypoxylon sp. FL1150]